MSDDVRLSFGVPIACAVKSDVGRVRANNEDAFGIRWRDDGALLVAVCDGMGGHEAGEVASSLAVEEISAHFDRATDGKPQAALHEALLAANRAILEEGRQGGKRGMGTTAVVAEIHGHTVHVGLVGDSRLYHIRRGHVLERTIDHTRVQSLLARGVITEDEARDHPESGMLTLALGHAKMSNGKPLRPEVFAEPLKLAEGDALVLSTDGLHDLADDWEIAAAIAGETPEVAASMLIDLALERGGHDNVTVAVVTVGPRSSGYDAAFTPPVASGAQTAPAAAPVTRPSTEPAAPAPAPASPAIVPTAQHGAPDVGSDDRLLFVAAVAGGVLLFLSALMLVVAAQLALG